MLQKKVSESVSACPEEPQLSWCWFGRKTLHVKLNPANIKTKLMVQDLVVSSHMTYDLQRA